MKKTEVNICDVCRQVITNKKCEICDKDICENCEDDMGVGLATGGLLFHVISCKSCSKKLEKAKLKQYFDEKTHREIRKGIIDIFRNAMVVENLQDDEEQEADKQWMMKKMKKESGELWDGGFIKKRRGTLRRVSTDALLTNALYSPFKTLKGGKTKL